MARYKLSNALRHCDPEEFKTDKAAWNKLRKYFLFKEDDGTVSGCYIWMWKEYETIIDINNEEKYVEMHNKKYGHRPYGYGPDNAKLMVVGEPCVETYWKPVLVGVTSDPYNVVKNK